MSRLHDFCVGVESFMTFPGYDPKKGMVFACTKFLGLICTQINDFSSAHKVCYLIRQHCLVFGEKTTRKQHDSA